MTKTKAGSSVVLVGCMALFALAQPAGAQPKSKPKTGTWEAVKGLSAGTDVRVKLSDKRNVRGRVQEVTADSVVVVNSANQAETLARDSVVRLSVKVGGNRGKNAAIGLAIGAGAGAGFGSASDWRSLTVPFFAVLIGAIGGVIGAFVPGGGWFDVYRS
jgi:hypothetical protein